MTHSSLRVLLLNNRELSVSTTDYDVLILLLGNYCKQVAWEWHESGHLTPV